MPLLQTVDPKRVCVVRLGGMGDILLSTPAIRALHRAFPDTQIDYIVGKNMADALTGIPYLRRVISFDKKRDARASRFIPFLRNLSRERYDLFINYQRSVKTVAMALASRAPRVITFHHEKRPLPETGRRMHAVDNFARELARLGVQVGRDRHLDFFIPDVARERVDALLLAEGIGPHDPLIVVNPGGTWPNKVWPPRHIGELLEILNAEMPQVRLAICGGPEDVAIAQESLAHADRARVALLAGRTSVKELGALLARADLVVSGDTGPLHIASAVGAQIVGLYGPNDPDRSGPVGAQHLVVVHREGLDCVPCYRTTCARGDNACMVRLSARRVADAVRHQMLNAQEQSDGRPLRTRLERASGFPRIEYGEVA